MTASHISRLLFWGPALATVVLHAMLLYMLTINWSSRTDAAVKPRQLPKYVQARLIEVQAPRPKPAAAAPKPKSSESKPSSVAAKPKAKPKPKPKPVARTEAKPEPKPEPVEPKPEPPKTPTAEERAETARDELALAMEAEDELLEAASDEQLTSSYVALIARAIEENWSRPPSARNEMEAELIIQLIPTGKVVSVSVARSSGLSAFDQSAVRAVQKAESFPELQQLEPRLFEQNFRRLRLKFKPEDLRY